MSSVSSRPRVKAINTSVLTVPAISCAEAVLSLLTGAVRLLETASRTAYRETLQTLPVGKLPALLPVTAIRAQMPTVECGLRQEVTRHHLPPVEAAKVTSLLKLQSAPYICDSALLSVPLEALLKANKVTEAEKASRHLMEIAEESHHRTVTSALVVACRNASVQAGFSSVNTTKGLDGSIRMIASDQAGRALVTEIHAEKDHEPSLETEVVGVSDGSCVGILDRFDQALEEQGVRAGTPSRKWTGGICELELAKQFLRRKAQSSATGSSGEALRRRRSLNPKPKLGLRRL
jgi:hypothetical protein